MNYSLPNDHPDRGAPTGHRAPWQTYADRIGALDSDLRPLFPDFLVVSPSRTGTTWLAGVLGEIDGIYVPPEKELHYFDYGWKGKSLADYAGKFEDGRDDIKGEVTPTYALLPSDHIAHIAALNPTLKIVVILRNLVDRSWSNLNHCLKCREDTFRHHDGSDVCEADMVRHFLSDYVRSENDYVGLLRRWNAHFPVSSFFVEYFENAVARPIPFFTRLLRFLGGAVPKSWDGINIHQPRNASEFRPRPDRVDRLLAGMYADWESRIRDYVSDTFGRACPWHWRKRPDYPWPMWVCDVGDRYRVNLDRHRFVATDIARATTVAEHLYLGDLLAALASSRMQEETPSTGLTALVRRVLGRNLLAPVPRGNFADRVLARKRLTGLLEAINHDRVVFETQTELADLALEQANLSEERRRVEVEWQRRGTRIEELEAQLQRAGARNEELARELVYAQAALATSSREKGQIEEDWRKRGLRIEELQNQLEQAGATMERWAQTSEEKDERIRELETNMAAREGAAGSRQPE